jgi:hypothetical protein
MLKKALEVLGAFLSFFFILFGTYLLFPQVISESGTFTTGPDRMLIHASNVTYYITFVGDRAFTIIDVMISAGLTYFWLQRRK